MRWNGMLGLQLQGNCLFVSKPSSSLFSLTTKKGQNQRTETERGEWVPVLIRSIFSYQVSPVEFW